MIGWPIYRAKPSGTAPGCRTRSRLKGCGTSCPAGPADGIIDLSSTGRTPADNGLVVLDEIAQVSRRLIANYVSYKIESTTINELVERLGNNDRG